jgi:hypothetical protein
MEIKEKIQTWLDSENRNYQDGLSLASQVLNNRNLISHLHKKENAQSRDKLQYELGKFIGATYKPLPEVLPQVKASVEVADEENDEQDDSETILKDAKDAFLATLPEPIQVLYANKRTAYNKRNQISQSMQDLTSDGNEFDQAQLEALKKEADGYDEEIKAIDSQLEYYHQNGALPIKTQPGELVTITADQKKAKLQEFKRLIDNMGTAVSKAKKKAESKPDNVSYAQDQAKLEAELAALRFERDALKAQATV